MKNGKYNTLVEALLSALTLEWSDNGNIMADAVRDMCIQSIADSTGTSFGEVLRLVDERAEELQG